MKRDTSRIFTVPEDAELDATHYNASYSIPAYNSSIKRKEEVSNISEPPKYQHPLTPSVCSTPLKDVNRVLHDFAVSICAATEETEDDQTKEINPTKNENKEIPNTDEIPDVVKEALRCKRLNKLRNVTPKEKLILQAKDRNTLSLSLTDLEDSQRKHSNKIPLKTYSLGLPKLNNMLSVDIETESPKKQKHWRVYHTITDPLHPVFRSDGIAVSQSLFDDYISSHYQELDQVSKLPETLENLVPFKNEKFQIKADKDNESSQLSKKPNVTLDVRLENKNKQETYRRSMSLPLKPMNILDNEDKHKSASSESGGIFEPPQRRKLDGLQLTPLMSKLSLLADEKTSGFCSRETTPSEFRDSSSFSILSQHQQLVKSKLDAVNKEGFSDNDDEIDEDWTSMTKDDGNFEKGELFLCGHQNMVMVLLMEDGTANDPDLIHSLVSMLKILNLVLNFSGPTLYYFLIILVEHMH